MVNLVQIGQNDVFFGRASGAPGIFVTFFNPKILISPLEIAMLVRARRTEFDFREILGSINEPRRFSKTGFLEKTND